MKSFVLLTLLIGSALDAYSQDISPDKVPPVVKTALMTKFPQALDLEWEKKQNLFEADFDLDHVEYAALIDAAGKILMSKKEILLTELPASVTAAIKKDFPGYTLDDAERIESNGEVLFQLEVEKDNQELRRVFSANGSLNTTVSFWD